MTIRVSVTNDGALESDTIEVLLVEAGTLKSVDNRPKKIHAGATQNFYVYAQQDLVIRESTP